MKVVQINIFYDEGSTGKIVADVHHRLQREGHESHVIHGLGKLHKDRSFIHKISSNSEYKWWGRWTRITGLRYNCNSSATNRAIRIIDKIKPDLVHIHCMNCFYLNPYKLLKWLGKHDYKVLVTHHADVTISGTCDHAFECEKWKTGCSFNCKAAKKQLHSKFFQLANISWTEMKNALCSIPHLYASGVSKWMADRVMQSPMFAGRECRIIENGLDINAFHYIEDISELRNKHNVTFGQKVILHVTPNLLSPLKGGKYVIELAKRLPECKFIIVGAKGQVPFELPLNVEIVAHTSSKEELAKYYSMADATLLTSYRESFSMVTAESLCCGTPVVGFKAGAPETISIPEYSRFVEYGDMEALRQAVEDVLSANFDKEAISNMAVKRYDAEIMYSNYLRFYKDIVK